MSLSVVQVGGRLLQCFAVFLSSRLINDLKGGSQQSSPGGGGTEDHL